MLPAGGLVSEELNVPCQEPERSSLVDGERIREQVNSEWNATVERMEDEIRRLREALEWINAEPEDPLKVQMWALAALGRLPSQ